MGHCSIRINTQSVVAVPHTHITERLLASYAGGGCSEGFPCQPSAAPNRLPPLLPPGPQDNAGLLAGPEQPIYLGLAVLPTPLPLPCLQLHFQCIPGWSGPQKIPGLRLFSEGNIKVIEWTESQSRVWG